MMRKMLHTHIDPQKCECRHLVNNFLNLHVGGTNPPESEPIMSKRTVTESTELATTDAIQPLTTLTPASVLGISTKMEIAESLLPQEFQGQELETLDSGFEPTVKWVTPGNFVGGTFLSWKENVGPNNSRLYSFEAGGQPFAIWGTSSLDHMMDEGMKRGQIAPGRKMLLIYMGTVETDKQPCKLFQIKVLKQK